MDNSDLNTLNKMIEKYESLGNCDLMLLVYNAYTLGLNSNETKTKRSGVQIIDDFMADCKQIDPSLRSIKISMRGAFSREIMKEF
jgi:hypothetical protein